MKHARESEIPWVERRSPRGRFHLFRRDISQALGALFDKGVSGGGHRFDVELARLPPGATNFRFHAHAAQWELYLIRSGSGQLRTCKTTVPIVAGDAVICTPGDPHQFKNTGSDDLLYYVIADDPQADVGFYADSNKWCIKPHGKWFKLEETDYYADEE